MCRANPLSYQFCNTGDITRPRLGWISPRSTDLKWSPGAPQSNIWSDSERTSLKSGSVGHALVWGLSQSTKKWNAKSVYKELWSPLRNWVSLAPVALHDEPTRYPSSPRGLLWSMLGRKEELCSPPFPVRSDGEQDDAWVWWSFQPTRELLRPDAVVLLNLPPTLSISHNHCQKNPLLMGKKEKQSISEVGHWAEFT